jgi:hypothetical protein
LVAEIKANRLPFSKVSKFDMEITLLSFRLTGWVGGVADGVSTRPCAELTLEGTDLITEVDELEGELFHAEIPC